MNRSLSLSKTKIKTYHHGDLRAALLKAAGELIRDHGAEALTLRACAREAGVSHGAPARHFVNLSGLLTAVAVEGFARLTVAMQPKDGSGGSALLLAGLGYIQFAMEEPEQFRIMWRCELLDTNSSALKEATAAARQPLLRALTVLYLEEHGRSPSDEILELRFNLAWCCVHGYASLWVEGKRQSRSLTAAKQMLTQLRLSL